MAVKQARRELMCKFLCDVGSTIALGRGAGTGRKRSRRKFRKRFRLPPHFGGKQISKGWRTNSQWQSGLKCGIVAGTNRVSHTQRMF